MKKILYIPALILICLSCEQVVEDFDVPEKPPKLVIHGRAEEDSLFRINLSKSLGFYDDNVFIPIQNASLQLLFNDQEMGSFSYDSSGWYENPGADFSQPGEYLILADAEGFKQAKARFTIPQKPDVQSISSHNFEKIYTDPSFPEGGYSEYYMHTTLHFRDNPDETNYYMLQILHKGLSYGYYPMETPEEIPSYSWEPLNMTCPAGLTVEAINSWDYFVLASPQDQEHYGQAFYMNDTYFDGDNAQFEFNVELSSVIYSQTDSADGKYILRLEFAEIDKRYFEYAKNRAATGEANDNIFAEPVTVYQSVENGFGLVYGINAFRDSINLLELEGPDLSGVSIEEDYYY
ncbi:MAG: DUF4249 family protein [Bacteroidales bacterium]|nr:DUF4249 family protein [Bacteroidales bacterium]